VCPSVAHTHPPTVHTGRALESDCQRRSCSLVHGAAQSGESAPGIGCRGPQTVAGAGPWHGEAAQMAPWPGSHRGSIAKLPSSGIMCAILMDDPTRGLLGSQPPDEPQRTEPDRRSAHDRVIPSGAGRPSSLEPSTAALATGRPSDPPAAGTNRSNQDAKFVGDAMRSLYRSSSTSVERGDATRVISRTDSTRPTSTPAPSKPPPPAPSSTPPGPRVDVALWLVLALGLFAIAGVMLSAAL